MKKVLIIKMGYSETLDRMLSLSSSLGDVLRTTFILHYFKDDDVSWLVDGKAAPLLEDNPYISRVLVYNPILEDQLRDEDYDLVVNFEKDPKICLLAKSLKAAKQVGFGFNGLSVDVDNYFDYLVGNKELIEINKHISKRKNNKYCWQKILADALGEEWNGEEYILGYQPTSKITFDIGFNWTTSNKWANKTWPQAYWRQLRDMAADQYSFTWQQGLASLHDYINWIHSCRLIVTSDSLGLHIALALKKKVIALFGPTSPKEVYFYDCGIALSPDSNYTCVPCLKPFCDQERHCMDYIDPKKVKDKIDYVFEEHQSSKTV